MAKIKISDLNPTGSKLFSDSESYMNELGDGELEMINGGTGVLLRASIRAGKYLYSVAVRNSHRIPRPDPTKISIFC